MAERQQGGQSSSERHRHGAEELCEAGERVYGEALRGGRVSRVVAEEAPCLIDLALLHPDPRDMEWLLPANPGDVMSRLLRGVREDVAAAHLRAEAVGGAFERFAGLAGAGVDAGASGQLIQVLEGIPRINRALDEAIAGCAEEMLAVQPDGIRPEIALAPALPRSLDMARRGVRMRSLYTHVARHGQGLHSYLEKVGPAAEVRTLDEVVERLIVIDRTVAFIPGSADRTIALELHHSALIEYLVIVFERQWHLGVPLREQPREGAGRDGVTRREHAIAALLAEGCTDAEVAQRLGMHVRTCREHIRRLSEALGSSSRAQLGVRIAQAGLDVPPPTGAR